MDLTDLTEWKLKCIVQQTWQIKINKLSSIHYSPPCETYSFAHHGHNPHRQGSKPRAGMDGTLARQHDAMNGVVLNTLSAISIHAKRTVMSVEQPLCYFQYMLFTKKLLSAPGWIHRQGDHCSNRYDWEKIFPCKRTSWFLCS